MISLRGLNAQQLQAVKQRAGPSQVIAGAGTGKTEVISNRIAYLIEQKIARPEEIVALTFTDKAAREMESRVSQLLNTFIFDVNITTFNAFGHQLLQRYSFDIGLSGNLMVMNSTQQLVFMAEHLDKLKLDYYAPVTQPQAILAELGAYYAKLKQLLITPDIYHAYNRKLHQTAKDQADRQEYKRHRELAKAYENYLKLCRIHNVIDFEDQIYLTVELLKKRLNICQQLSTQYRFWLVDEFQDTNHAQSQLLDLLSSDSPAGGGSNVMVVGDDDQSIYAFRGAALSNILDFKERHSTAKQITLLKNYRSSQQILDASYRLIQNNNPDRLEAKYQLNKRLVAQFNAVKPQFKHFIEHTAEAEWIASDVARRLKKGEDPDQIAILLRKHTQAHILERHLKAKGVEYIVVGETENLYRQPEVKQLLYWLRVVADPADSDSLYHLLSSQTYSVDVAWLRELSSQARRQHESLEKILAVQTNTPKQLLSFLDKLAGWRQQLPILSVGQLCYQFLQDTKRLSKLIAAAKDNPALDDKLAQLNQFFNSLGEYEQIAEDASAIGYLKNLPALLDSGERLTSEDIPDLYGQKIKLLTIHKAKGLEFNTVYIFDLSQDTFPARQRGGSLEVPEAFTKSQGLLAGNPRLEEERRLMYVAMTRAKRNLILSFAFNHGGIRAKRPSIFIEEALGPQPQLDQLRTPPVRTNQIELFKTANSSSHQPQGQLSLPTTMQQGEQLVLTVAQIQDYLNCPAEFYLRHILSPPQPPNFALAYGTLLHTAVQLYNHRRQSGQNVGLNQLQSYLRDNWPKEGFHSLHHRQRGLKQALATVSAFYKREQALRRTPLYSEKAFELTFPEQQLTIKGRFDVVLPAGEGASPVRNRPAKGTSAYRTGKVTTALGRSVSSGVEIRDYKTGASRVSTQERANRRAKDSLQLSIYALAWQQLKGELPHAVSLDFIDTGFIGVAAKSARQLQTVEQKIAEVAAGVMAGNFIPGSNHIFCSHQEFGF